MATLGDVKAGIRSLLDDDDQEWTNDAFLTPKINQAAKTLTLYAKSAAGFNLQRQVQVLNIQVGLNSLAQYQQGATGATAGGQGQPAGPLSRLTDPIEIWWKQAGTRNWRPANRIQSLEPGLTPRYSGLQFSWLSNIVEITPMATAIDIVVDGRFNPPIYQQDSDQILVHPDFDTALVWAGAGLAGAVRQNVGYSENYTQQAQNAMDNIVADIIRQNQGAPGRIGKLNPTTDGYYFAR